TQCHKVHTRLIPNQLDDTTRVKRVNGAKIMLPTLRKCKANDYRYLWTGDESYVFYCYRHSSQWIEGQQEAKQESRKREHDPKVMLTVFLECIWFSYLILDTEGVNNGCINIHLGCFMPS
ncbi:MAG: hypothetical protein EZS28_047927, partial [Streblomastix strix]